MVDISALQPGDVIIIKHNGKPYHVAIYAPHTDRMCDIVHMGNGFYNTGAMGGSLASMCHLHRTLSWAGNTFFNYSGMPNTLDIQVFRSKTLQGTDIANQALAWMHQGVGYDEKRLLNTIQFNNVPQADITDEERTLNALTYLKFAARRETTPIKTPFFPNSASSIFAAYGTLFTAPSLNLPYLLVCFGLWCLGFGTNSEGRSKGFSCAGFVLACIGAVALKDEIAAVTPDNGWVSLKYAPSPENQDSSYAAALNKVKPKLGNNPALHPGLDVLLTEQQIQEFDVDRLTNKLSFLANLHPHYPSVNAFQAGMQQDTDNWQDMGLLKEIKLGVAVSTKSKPFNKAIYRQERRADNDIKRSNHQIFGQQYGGNAFIRDYKIPLSQKVVMTLSREIVSDITPLRKNKM